MLFLWFFFRNVTKLYEFRYDTCFLSVRLRNLTGHVITPFLAFEMLQKLTDCVTILPFDFRHVTKFHGLRNNACFWFLACLGTSRIVQNRVPSTSKRSTKGCMPSKNCPRTKLGYDKYYYWCRVCVFIFLNLSGSKRTLFNMYIFKVPMQTHG